MIEIVGEAFLVGLVRCFDAPARYLHLEFFILLAQVKPMVVFWTYRVWIQCRKQSLMVALGLFQC